VLVHNAGELAADPAAISCRMTGQTWSR
jgi:hypothetical protein